MGNGSSDWKYYDTNFSDLIPKMTMLLVMVDGQIPHNCVGLIKDDNSANLTNLDLIETFVQNLPLNTLEKNNSKPLLPIPNAGQIIMSLPICSLLSSLGQRCKVYSTSAQTTHRLFTDQKIENIELGSSKASIETDDWYYSIGNVEENDSGFTFDFTDDALLATYHTQSTYYVELDKGSMTWVIVGDELGYNSGRKEEHIGKYISYDSPIILPITQ